VTDQILGDDSKSNYRVFLSNSITLVGINDRMVIDPLTVAFQSENPVQVCSETYLLATGFNQRVESHFLSVDFQGSLTTVFTIHT
jgi:hypothetical protein